MLSECQHWYEEEFALVRGCESCFCCCGLFSSLSSEKFLRNWLCFYESYLFFTPNVTYNKGSIRLFTILVLKSRQKPFMLPCFHIYPPQTLCCLLPGIGYVLFVVYFSLLKQSYLFTVSSITLPWHELWATFAFVSFN